MGQTNSSLKSTLVFAYLNNPQIDEAINVDTPERDCLLLYPEIYGLKSNVFVNSRNTKRPDSGFVSNVSTSNLALLRDLAYVDHTYYSTLTLSSSSSSSLTQQQQQHHHSHSSIANTDGPTHISFADAMLTSPAKSLREIYLTGRSIHYLSPNIGMLSTIQRLDLSNNHLTQLPESIGCMQSLEYLSVSRNQLTHLPSTIGYLSNLLELDLSYNKINNLTPSIAYLKKLKSLSVTYNLLERLPIEIGGLVSLIALDLSRNLLRALPAEISKLPFLRRMRLEGCPLYSELVYPLVYHPISLVETCARAAIRNQVKTDTHLPQHLTRYIQSAKPCTSCGGPYIESYVLRGRWIEKADLQVPLEYTLCSAHWSDADDRVLNMFSEQPETTVNHPIQLLNLPKLPRLAGPTTIDRLGSLTRQTRHTSSALDSSVMAEGSEDNPGSHRFSLLKQHTRRRLHKSNIADWASKFRGQRQH